MNFSVSNLTYDANGNILTMNQNGLKINTSPLIDQFNYTYIPNTNKLKNVRDQVNDATSRLGDFKTSALHPQNTAKTNATTQAARDAIIDYTYDANGNLTKDFNKDIATASGGEGIQYNYLNLPGIITIKKDASAIKGTITYTYDVAGNKLKKVTLENNASVLFNKINYTSNITTTTQYVSGFVYESKGYSNSTLASLQYTDVLQFTGHEEGRIRRKIDGTFAYDYFLKDHLGNIRMVLTEEKKTDSYPAASMETAQAATEEALYANLPETRTAKPAGYPTDNYTNPNNNVARVKAATGSKKMGPSIILKVMAGDTYNLRVSSWYKKNGSTPSNTNTIVSDLVTNMINSLTGPGALLHGNITPTHLTNSGVISSSATSFLNNQPAPGTTKPKAYLNWVLLDEQFKLVATNSSGAEQVGNDLEFKVHVKNNLPVSKSGCLYVYVSNESSNIDVYFDNLQITHVRGPILEETHYYPFGLTMAGISSKAAGGLENKKKYNGIEFDQDLGLDSYEAFYRNLDPQTGRWWQIDPETENMEMWSPYVSNYDNPILYQDPLGDEGECCGWLRDIATTVAATTSVVIDNVLFTNFTGSIANSGAIPTDQINTWNTAVTSANNASLVAGVGATAIGGGTAAGAVSVTVGSGGLSVAVSGPAFVAGAIAAGAGTVVTYNASKNLSQGNGLIREKSSANSNSPNSTNNKHNEKKRVVDQKSGEKAQNQLEGIEKAQTKAKKNASSQGTKQAKINSTEKSKQNLKKELRSTKTAKDADKF